MKLFSITVYYKTEAQVKALKSHHELSTFSFYQRGSVKEFMTFTGQIIIERSEKPSRSSVKERDYMVHAYVREDGLSAVVISDTEYPQRVAFSLLSRVLGDFSDKIPAAEWASAKEESVNYPHLPAALERFQNPSEADSMTKVQNELDATKVVMIDNINLVLERGEKLDDLVEKSDALSGQSKMFYKQAKKMNSCCSWG